MKLIQMSQWSNIGNEGSIGPTFRPSLGPFDLAMDVFGVLAVGGHLAEILMMV